VFPPAMAGTGDGHRPFDLAPNRTMTNGTVGDMVASNGRTLTLKYKGGEKKIIVPEDVPVVNIEAGKRSMLVAGAKVVVRARKNPDDSLTAVSVSVGKNGITPPMYEERPMPGKILLHPLAVRIAPLAQCPGYWRHADERGASTTRCRFSVSDFPSGRRWADGWAAPSPAGIFAGIFCPCVHAMWCPAPVRPCVCSCLISPESITRYKNCCTGA